jgi:hypothetical protein
MKKTLPFIFSLFTVAETNVIKTKAFIAKLQKKNRIPRFNSPLMIYLMF